MAKLTQEDLKTISAALSDGIEWRDGIADAYSRTGPQAALAKATVERYERLHVKLTGRPSHHALTAASDKSAKRISIFDLEDPK